jgi:3-oxoadipate enol-lactonase
MMRNHAIRVALLCALGAAIAHGQIATPVGTSEGFVQVDGGKLYYQECGNGPKAVLLMHDGVVNSAVWNGVWESFCREFHTIRYDRRGYGHSPETTKPYYEADDLAGLLTDRKVTHAALVASSHGGGVALNFAVRYPAQVSHLVLIGPAPNGFPYSEQFIQAQLPFQDQKDPVKVRVESDYLIAPGNEAAREQLRKLLEASPQDHSHNDMPLPEKPVFPDLANLRVPVLILTGSADIADNQAAAGALEMAITGAQRAVVPNTGHLLYLERPNEFFALVTQFLKAHQF